MVLNLVLDCLVDGLMKLFGGWETEEIYRGGMLVMANMYLVWGVAAQSKEGRYSG